MNSQSQIDDGDDDDDSETEYKKRMKQMKYFYGVNEIQCAIGAFVFGDNLFIQFLLVVAAVPAAAFGQSDFLRFICFKLSHSS